MSRYTLFHNLIDIHNQTIYPAAITVDGRSVVSIEPTENKCLNYILPGFIDSHIHIESSMLIPSEFARMAVKHGTVATISDPHEIANVCGVEGVEFMLANAKKVPFKFHFGAPSCVPATPFETAGASLGTNETEHLLQRDDIYFLSEMMNYPAVLNDEQEVLQKIKLARVLKKPVDGHAPGLRGQYAKKYIQAGISTDHECYTKEEALEKIGFGMKILIREGSAARNFEALIDLLNDFEDEIMFCCDDKHPDELLLHHINLHVKRALDKGIDLFKVLKAACLNPVIHYKIDVGLLRVNDKADFIVIDNLSDFNILQTVIDGEEVYGNEKILIQPVKEGEINKFACSLKQIDDFRVRHEGNRIKVIEALDGQLTTGTIMMDPLVKAGWVDADISRDILKIVVVNRYADEPVAKAFIRNFGLQKGAIASTVAHDSHNIVCVGTDDASICGAVNALIEIKGGIVVFDPNEKHVMRLPVGGLMSNRRAEDVAAMYSLMDKKAKALGSKLSAPFMTLSFMALLVIPQLKLSDKGLFDGQKFTFTSLFD